ncbi:MAG: alpha/beta fold hydrolase [Burkholderiales bacterium]
MKKPVVFFPGLLCDARMWAPQIEALSATIDPWVADFTRDDSIAGMASRALAECPFPTFSLAGLSMGGYVSMEAMRQAPDRVERLALLDTQARSDTTEAKERRLALMALANRGEFVGVSDRLMPLFLHPARLNDERLTGLCKDMAQAVGKDAFLRQQTAIMARIDSRPSLAAIRCPTLVLCGDSDLLTPLDRHEEIAQSIPGAKLVVIPGCGHMATIEAPEAVNRALDTWLTH